MSRSHLLLWTLVALLGVCCQAAHAASTAQQPELLESGVHQGNHQGAHEPDYEPPPESLPAEVKRPRTPARLQTKGDSPVSVQATLSHSAFNRSAGTLFLKIDLAGIDGPVAKRRPPLNVALVIDQSGSMAKEKKFEHAIQAAKLLVKNLTKRDIVSIVSFSLGAVVLSPAGLAVNREFLDHRLHEVVPEGGTNLSAGLLEAFAQIDSKAAEGQTKRVIVLTDGMANLGVTDPKQLRGIVELAREKGIGLSAMGCGDEFDEDLLTSLCEAGGGRYTFIRSPEQIPGAMSTELEGLLAIVAQNVTLEVATTGAEIISVHGRQVDPSTNSKTFDLGDVRAGDRGVLMLGLKPSSFEVAAEVTVDCTLTLDRVDLAKRERRDLRAQATMTADDSEVRSSLRGGVLLYAEVLQAVARAEDAVLGLDGEGLDEAIKLFDLHYDRARRHAIDVRDQQLLNQAFMLKHLMEDLSHANEKGLLHEHGEARSALRKEVTYRRYLREHHRSHR